MSSVASSASIQQTRGAGEGLRGRPSGDSAPDEGFAALVAQSEAAASGSQGEPAPAKVGATPGTDAVVPALTDMQCEQGCTEAAPPVPGASEPIARADPADAEPPGEEAEPEADDATITGASPLPAAALTAAGLPVVPPVAPSAAARPTGAASDDVGAIPTEAAGKPGSAKPPKPDGGPPSSEPTGADAAADGEIRPGSHHARRGIVPPAGDGSLQNAGNRTRSGAAADDVLQVSRSASDAMQPVLPARHDQAQAASPNGPAAASTDSTGRIPVEGLAVEIAARFKEGGHRFEIRLDPPELGRIEVRLDIDRAGQVTSRLVVERAETLDMLRRDVHQLERALQDAGFRTADSGLQLALRDHAFSDRRQADAPPPSQSGDGERPAAEAVAVTYALIRRASGGIDIRI